MVAEAVESHKYVGQSIKRRDNPRLMSGLGSFIDDIRLTDMSDAEVVRSTSAHARIVSIDTSTAITMPDVLAIFTGEDFPELAALPCAWQAAGVTNNVNTPHVEVHQVGDPSAVVVAESMAQARDAAEAVRVELEDLEVVVDAASVLAPYAPQLHENAPGNVVLVRTSMRSQALWRRRKFESSKRSATNVSFQRRWKHVVRLGSTIPGPVITLFGQHRRRHMSCGC